MKHQKTMEELLDRASPEELDSFFTALGEPAPSEPPEAVRRTVLAQIAPPAVRQKKKTARTAVLIAACAAVLAAILIAVPLFLRGVEEPPLPGTWDGQTCGETPPDGTTAPQGYAAVSIRGYFGSESTVLRLSESRYELYRRGNSEIVSASSSSGSAGTKDAGTFGSESTVLRLSESRYEPYRLGNSEIVSASSSSGSAGTKDAGTSDAPTAPDDEVTLTGGRVQYEYEGIWGDRITAVVLDPGGSGETRLTVSGDGSLSGADGLTLTAQKTLPEWAALKKFGGLWYCPADERLLFVGAGTASLLELLPGWRSVGPYTVVPSRSWTNENGDTGVISLSDGLSLTPSQTDNPAVPEFYFTAEEDGTLILRGQNAQPLGTYVRVRESAFYEVRLRTDRGTLTVPFQPFDTAVLPAGGPSREILSALPALIGAEPMASLGDISVLTADRARVPADITFTVLDAAGNETVMASPEFVCPSAPGRYLLRIEAGFTTDYSVSAAAGSIRLRLYADLSFTVTERAEPVDFTYEIRGSGGNASIALTSYTGESGDVVIPASIGGIPVTKVVFETFDKSRITSLAIPDSVTGTLNLTDFPLLSRVNSDVEGRCVVPAGISCFSAIRSPRIREIVFAPGSACTGVSGIHDMDALTSVVLPDTVTEPPSLGNCPLLTDVTFGDGIRKVILSVGGCPALSRMTLGKNVTEVCVTFPDGQPVPDILYPCTREVWEKIDVSDRDLLTAHVTFGTIGEAPAGYEPPLTNFAAALLASDYRFTTLWADIGRFDGGEFACETENPLNSLPSDLPPGARLRIDFAIGEQYGFAEWKPECLALTVTAAESDGKGEAAGPAQPLNIALPLTVTERGCEIGLSALSDALAAVGGRDGTIVELILTCNDENSGDNAVRVRFGQY